MKTKLPLKSYQIPLIICFILLGTYSIGFAQSYSNYKTASKKVLKFYERGKAMHKAKQLKEAERYFTNSIKEDPQFIDGYIKLGDIALVNKDYTNAMAQFEQVVALDSTYSLRIHSILGKLYYQTDQLDKAIPHLAFFVKRTKNERSKANTQKLMDRIDFAMEAMKNPVPFVPHRLPSAINTSGWEYLPSFRADGKQLVFTRVVSQNLHRGQEDFYYSEKVNGQWVESKPIIELNTPNNQGAQSISGDGQTLVFTGCQQRDGMGSCDLYISYRNDGLWSKPINMGAVVNSASWESQPTLSANGDFLFFASNRKGGLGGSDIYVSYKMANGLWGEPQNLGPGINTAEDDQGPFFHADRRTLYFVSKGYPGMGGLDLYKAQLLGDGVWSKPENLGYPINTRGDESTLVVSLDGKTGYFASNYINKSLSTTDIYEFELYEGARPLPVTYLEAQVVDAITKEPLNAAVELFDVQSEQVFYKNKTNSEGKVIVSLVVGNNYGLNVDKEGYLFHSENFNLDKNTRPDKPYELYIELYPIRPIAIQEEDQPEAIVLNNIFFATASAELLPSSFKELNKLYELLSNYPGMKIRLEGHTDDVGSEEDNMNLSRNRAKAVFQFLVDKGIPEGRLSYIGYGESQPIDTNETEEGRQRNRRTAFMVIE